MKKTFQPNEEGMAACLAFLETFCEEPKPSIILDEIVSNIVRCAKASYFSLDFERAEGLIRMTFEDDGEPFDPTVLPEPDIHASAEERTVGGLGIFMVKKMSKSVTYAREEGRNVLIVTL